MFGIISDIVGNLAGNMFADERQKDSQVFNAGEAALGREFNSAEAVKAREFSATEAQKQRDWTAYMSSTAYRRATQDMMSAGLNPMLAYHQGGAQTGSGASAGTTSASGGHATAGIASPTVGHSIASGMQSASQVEVNRAIEERTRAEADKIKAEEEEIKARTPTHAVSIDQMRQNIEESKTRIERILADIPLITQQTHTSAAQAAHFHQQIVNLKETIPQLRENVRQLHALTRLHGAHEKESGARTIEAGARTTVHDATYDEIRNRVRANLPEVDRLIKDLEAKAAKLTMPARGMDAAAANSFLGSFRAALRALTGQQAILGK